LTIFVLRGSVATQLKYGGKFNNYVIASCTQNPTIEFWKSIDICRTYEKWQSRTFFGTQCTI